jgi:hypothetical protein
VPGWINPEQAPGRLAGEPTEKIPRSIAADQKFKGQQYAVSGVIEDIKADGAVTLKTPVRDLKVLGVRCEFADASTLAKLKSSRAVRLLGTIEGMKSGFLVISNCSLSQ